MQRLPRFARLFLLLMAATLWAAPAGAAPPLSESDQQRIADGTTPRSGAIDGEDGFYVLLRNAAGWSVDDFAGAGGAKTPPQADYAYLAQNPGQVLGKLFTIEGRFVQQVRYPTGDQTLLRAGGEAWGDRVTRWAIRVSDDPDDTVLVFFNDPEGEIKPPDNGQPVRVAARFYKVWQTETDKGEPFEFLVFVGGARQVVPHRNVLGSGPPLQGIIVALIVMSIAAFFVIRYLFNRKAATGAGGRTQAYLETRRRDRELYEMDHPAPEDADLPDDPAEAMKVLRQRHDTP